MLLLTRYCVELLLQVIASHACKDDRGQTNRVPNADKCKARRSFADKAF